MPLTKPPPGFDGTASSRAKVKTRPHTASGSYSKSSTTGEKLKSIPYSNTASAKPPTPLTKPPSNDGPHWFSGLNGAEKRRRRPRTGGETSWERRAREYEEGGIARRQQWAADRQSNSASATGSGSGRDRETYMDGDGFIHTPLTRTDTRESEGHVLEKVRTLDAKEHNAANGNNPQLLGVDTGRTRRRAVESGLWEIGTKEPVSMSDEEHEGVDVIDFRTDAEEQEREREEFTPLTTPLLDSKLDFMSELSFSNRGSVLLSGKKALEVKEERKRAIARANRRSLQEIESEDVPDTSAAAQSSQVDGAEQVSTVEPTTVPLPLSPPEPSQTTDGALTPEEPTRESPPTPEPSRAAPPIPVPEIEPLAQRVRAIGEEPEAERPSSSPPPATPTERPQSSPEPSRLGINANPLSAAIAANLEPEPILLKQLEARPRPPPHRHTMPRSPSIRTLSQEIEAESVKVRSMYEAGTADATDWRNGALCPPSDAYVPRNSTIEEDGSTEDVFTSTPANRSDSTLRQRPHTAHPSSSTKRERVMRRENELAGGIEDWDGIEAQRVDRYGFIVEPPSPSSGKGKASLDIMMPPPPPQRVATGLQLASEMPRQGIFGRRPSAAGTSMKNGQGGGRGIDRMSSNRSLRTQATGDSSHRSPARTSRAIINRLPGMSERRVMDEAGDMLTLPPGLSSIAEPSPAVLEARRRTEARRAEKWRRMARVVKSPASSQSTPNKDGTPNAAADAEAGTGGGMHFEFNTRDPKLISRVWKGIPDRWRATAWHSFLSTSAKKHAGAASDEELTEAFRELVDCSSADDVQIDMDVPRTINSHIMFRSRYRGGQRLLFRVLHSLSLYFPETGYVQGMASLAATLLCYFSEEGAFVLAVRMWEYRGLKKLYAPGFEGLMSALDEFREEWLMRGNAPVGRMLDEMGVHPTAYGTRWYLTLFNYSVPFETQLRVWDLFMLLGDETECWEGHEHGSLASVAHHGVGERPSSSGSGATAGVGRGGDGKGEVRKERMGFHGQLDILHAAGCAIVDGTREQVLGSDFENVMKTLTSWVPVRDEEIFVRVVRAEWRRHGRK